LLIKDHQEKVVCSDFITLGAHLVGNERAAFGTASSHVARAANHFQEHDEATNDCQSSISEVWLIVESGTASSHVARAVHHLQEHDKGRSDC
jgi:hypothetical protein